MKGLLYTQYGKSCGLFLPTLDGSASILRPKYSMDFLHSILLTVKMGSKFPLFSSIRLVVSKSEPAVIVPIRKRSEMLHLLSPSILYYHNLPLLRLRKNSASALQTFWHPGYDESIFICGPLLTWNSQVYNVFGVGRGPKIYKKCTSNGGNNWG